MIIIILRVKLFGKVHTNKGILNKIVMGHWIGLDPS